MYRRVAKKRKSSSRHYRERTRRPTISSKRMRILIDDFLRDFSPSILSFQPSSFVNFTILGEGGGSIVDKLKLDSNVASQILFRIRVNRRREDSSEICAKIFSINSFPNHLSILIGDSKFSRSRFSINAPCSSILDHVDRNFRNTYIFYKLEKLFQSFAKN